MKIQQTAIAVTIPVHIELDEINADCVLAVFGGQPYSVDRDLNCIALPVEVVSAVRAAVDWDSAE